MMQSIRPLFTNPFSSPKRWLVMARLVTLVFMLSCVGWFIAGTFSFFGYASSHPQEFIPYSPPLTPETFGLFLGQFGLSIHSWLIYKLVLSIAIALVFWAVGFLLFLRKGNDWFGIYISAIFVLFGTVTGDPASAFSSAHPALSWLLTPLSVFAWLGLFLLLFLFPNGRFFPAWTRWIVLLEFLFYVLIIIDFGKSTPSPALVGSVLAMVGIGAGSQVYRYRTVSSLFERQQTKWVMFALVVVFIVLVLSFSPFVFPALLEPKPSANPITLVLVNLPYFITLIPISVAFAILRYRLWDIDLIIRRTLQYGMLSLVLGLVYLGLVILFGQVIRGFTGQESPLAVVLSTLIIAALFNPLRRSLQTFIDRRFFRQKYDAEQAMATFSSAMRREVQIDRLTNRLVAVIVETVQPEKIMVWLKPSGVGSSNPVHPSIQNAGGRDGRS